jgi:hypothetical protein
MSLNSVKFKKFTGENERSRGTKKWKKQRERNVETINSRRRSELKLKGNRSKLVILRGGVEVKHARKPGLGFY